MTNAQKFIVVCLLFIASCIGFMLKLPSVFRAHDKFLHAAFYFGAAAFFHILFRKGIAIILILLFLFGTAIEWAQEYSNKLTGKRIHGRFDIEDVYANTKGLLVYLGLWMLIVGVRFLWRQGNKE